MEQGQLVQTGKPLRRKGLKKRGDKNVDSIIADCGTSNQYRRMTPPLLPPILQSVTLWLQSFC